ncbi:hypothetical protein GALL_373190 [mine drainage metagenome]|uniref:Uncharacterized protein n=1 Tax=mine drainage metagenome TaxID=410659 RepID=A0A1J5QB77_9ZZZZ
MVVDPVLLVGAEAGEVELAHRDHGVPALAGDLVAVDREGVGELVVLLVLLELAERRAHDLRVEQPDRRGRLGVGAERPGRRLRGRVVWAHLDVVQTVGGLRRVDVALDVRGLELLLVRCHLEALHERRVDPADRDRGDHHDAEADRGQAPVAAERRHYEDDRDEDRDPREDLLRRDDGAHVRVRRPVEPVPRTRQQRVAVEPVVAGDQQHQHGTRHSELHTRGLRGARRLPADPDPAVQVLRRDARDPGEDRRRHEERHDEPQTGQLEDVERQVEVELRVLLPERDAVGPQLDRRPLLRRRDPREDADESRPRDAHEASQGLDRLAVLVQADLLLVGRRVDRARPVGRGQAGRDRAGHHDQTAEEQQPARHPLHPEHLQVPDLAEPEDLGPQLRRDEQRDDQGDEDHDGRSEGAPATPRRRRTGGARSAGRAGRRHVGCAS